MQYQKSYQSIIDRSISRPVCDGYTERHHIVPRCMGGGDDPANISVLTGREHYIAHKLLKKIHPTNRKLRIAFYFMSIDKHDRGYRVTSRDYEQAKKDFADGQRGANNPIHTPGAIEKSKASNAGRVSAFKGKKHSAESRKKQSDSHKRRLASGVPHVSTGRFVSAETRAKIGSANKGRVSKLKGIPRTEEDKLKISSGVKKFNSTEAGVAARKSSSERIKNYSPWYRARSVNPLWADASNVFLIWMRNGKPKCTAFSLIYNYDMGTSYKAKKFNNLIKKFVLGWVPEKDPAWVADFEVNPAKSLV